MWRRLHLIDWQGFKEVDIELAPFTVLVGPTNSGKSAITRAIEGLCFNTAGKGSIRHGKKEAMVMLDFDGPAGEPLGLAWVKGPESRYILYDAEGEVQQEWARLGRGVPDEVQQLLGVRDIEIDPQFSIRPQVHIQGIDYAWLLRESSARRARVLATMTALDYVVKAQGVARRKHREANDELKLAERHKAEAEAQLEEFVGLDEEAAKAKELQARYDEIVKQQRMLNRVAPLLDERARLVDVAGRQLPDVDLKELSNEAVVLQRASRLVVDHREAVRAAANFDAAVVVLEQSLTQAETALAEARAAIDVCDVCGRSGRSGRCPHCRKRVA